MTRKITVLLIILASYSTLTSASEYKFVADNQNAITRLCIAAAENDLAGLRIAIRKLSPSPHQKQKTVINSVRCNGQVAAHFAQTYLATETFGYLYKFTDKRNKKMVPYTSVEEFIASRGESKDPAVVIVQVAGSQ